MRATKLWLAFVAASLVSMGAMAQGIHVGYVQSRFSTAIDDGAPSKSEAMNGFEAGFVDAARHGGPRAHGSHGVAGGCGQRDAHDVEKDVETGAHA